MTDSKSRHPAHDRQCPTACSLDPRSPHFDETILSRGVGIKFNGKEKTSVDRIFDFGRLDPGRGRPQPRSLRQPMTVTLKGKVEPYFEGEEQAPARTARPDPPSE